MGQIVAVAVALSDAVKSGGVVFILCAIIVALGVALVVAIRVMRRDNMLLQQTIMDLSAQMIAAIIKSEVSLDQLREYVKERPPWRNEHHTMTPR